MMRTGPRAALVAAGIAMAPLSARAQSGPAASGAPSTAPSLPPPPAAGNQGSPVTFLPPNAPLPPVRPQATTTAPPATPAPAGGVQTKFGATFYGFVEGDAIADSTESFVDLVGNASIARPDTFAGRHARFQESARNSRLGFRLRAPDLDGGRIKVGGDAELDFLGNQPGVPDAAYTTPGGGSATLVSEAGFYTNPALRMRHLFLTADTPWGTVLVGQTWHLFAWEAAFTPMTVQMQGIPDELYARTPQFRYDYGVALGPSRLDVAVAALRPAQRDSGLPDGEAAVKLALPGLQAYVTNGCCVSGLQPAAIGISALGRRFDVPDDVATLTASTPVTRKYVGAMAFDLVAPVIPASAGSHADAMTLTAEYTKGTGDADQYTNLGFGTTPAGAIDSGMVVYDAANRPHTVDVESGLIGLQYYAPNGGKEAFAANAGFLRSGNLATMGLAPKKIWDRSRFADAMVFWDPGSGLRFGLEYARFWQQYLDGTVAVDQRVQLSGFYLF